MTRKIKYRPLFDNMILTADRKVFTASGIYLAEDIHGKGALKTTQTVLRVGENVPEYIQAGTVVEMNLETFPKKRTPAKHDTGPDTYSVLPPLYEDEEGKEFMIVGPRNLLYVIEK